MNDIDLMPFLGKTVIITLVNGEVLTGILRSTEARILGVGDYGIEAVRRDDDHNFNGPMTRGIASAIFIKSVHEYDPEEKSREQ